MGVTHKPNWAWLLDPLHLQQERYLCPLTRRHSLSQVSLSHLSLGFYNACLQIRDPLSAAMHHCQQDSGTWFPYTAPLSDLWQAPWRSRKNNPSIGHLNLSQQIWCRSSVGELLVRWALSSPPPVSFRSQTPHYIMLRKTTFIFFDIFASALSVKSFCVFWIPIHLKSLRAAGSETLFHVCGTIAFLLRTSLRQMEWLDMNPSWYSPHFHS